MWTVSILHTLRHHGASALSTRARCAHTLKIKRRNEGFLELDRLDTFQNRRTSVHTFKLTEKMRLKNSMSRHNQNIEVDCLKNLTVLLFFCSWHTAS